MSERHDRAGTEIVATAPNEVIAGLWRQVLADEGIVAALKPRGAGYAFGTSAMNEYYIFVRSDQAELARAIIADLESGEDSDTSSS